MPKDWVDGPVAILVFCVISLVKASYAFKWFKFGLEVSSSNSLRLRIQSIFGT
ncbi:hypothetical protein AXF42_Ash017628 [Apostasia shenzhenica]|uniref:Uncharacterized protein n=1 Tax=Apostasia shenzhenica TaxID=1088818 RepID=A0A2I0A5C6_9ASPA|nr:hypothetical protein AXF42_Ash017628 [Apostasia shenzhenica]